MAQKEKTLLRFATTGSVDDGKSTLIGRLLYETKSIYEDQYTAIEKTSKRKGLEQVDLALLLDGLSAEREQGITIDVAYRYFETPSRKFIIADTPGHIQYTRNMVTGASNVNLAIILIDARNGILTQSKRHGFIISLLQIPHLIIAVNKMDLVGYSEQVYNEIVEQYNDFSQKLNLHDTIYIPLSALKGDNVVTKSDKMPWYDGSTLLHYLENLHVSADRNLIDFRYPVQHVLRPNLNFRGFAGKIASGTINQGDEIIVLPSGKSSIVKSISTYDGELSEAFVPQSVVLTLRDEIDVSRGDMIVRKDNLPETSNHLDTTICWMDETALSTRTSYFLKHTTKTVRASITKVLYKIDVNTLHRIRGLETLALNDIGRVEIKTTSPVFFDPYEVNHDTGSFILIDPLTNNTVAAGMIRGSVRDIGDILKASSDSLLKQTRSPNTTLKGMNIPREKREERYGHKGAVLWFTGYSGSGKSTIAQNLENILFDSGIQTMLLDGDNMRQGLCGDLGFSDSDRSENIRRAGEVAKLFFESGHIVICTFISPFEKDRSFVRSLIPRGRFFETFIKCDIETCKERDPNGLYKKAISGEIKEFTGISSPYEAPQHPDILVETDQISVSDCTALIIEKLQSAGIIRL